MPVEWVVEQVELVEIQLAVEQVVVQVEQVERVELVVDLVVPRIGEFLGFWIYVNYDPVVLSLFSIIDENLGWIRLEPFALDVGSIEHRHHYRCCLLRVVVCKHGGFRVLFFFAEGTYGRGILHS